MSLTFAPSIIEWLDYPGSARVEETIAPSQRGWVAFEGSHWSAELYEPTCQEAIAPGKVVQVVGRLGNTLLVKELPSNC